MTPPTARPWLVLATIAFLYALDQLSKHIIATYLALEEAHPVIPGFFELRHQGNTGAAFSLFNNNNNGFLILSVVALIVLAVLYRRGAFRDPLALAGFCLLTPGVLGNLTDRILHGHVIDFLSFDLHIPGAHPWPTFNVADSCICLAVGCFLLGSILEMRQPQK